MKNFVLPVKTICVRYLHNIIFDNSNIRCSLFDQPKPSLQKFFKNCPTRSWELSMYYTAGAVLNFFFKNSPTQPTFVVQVVFKLFQLFDQFCEINNSRFLRYLRETYASW